MLNNDCLFKHLVVQKLLMVGDVCFTTLRLIVNVYRYCDLANHKRFAIPYDSYVQHEIEIAP